MWSWREANYVNVLEIHTWYSVSDVTILHPPQEDGYHTFQISSSCMLKVHLQSRILTSSECNGCVIYTNQKKWQCKVKKAHLRYVLNEIMISMIASPNKAASIINNTREFSAFTLADHDPERYSEILIAWIRCSTYAPTLPFMWQSAMVK